MMPISTISNGFSYLCSLTSPSPVHSAKSESTVAPSEEKERLVIIHTEETETKTGTLQIMLYSSRFEISLYHKLVEKFPSD